MEPTQAVVAVAAQEPPKGAGGVVMVERESGLATRFVSADCADRLVVQFDSEVNLVRRNARRSGRPAQGMVPVDFRVFADGQTLPGPLHVARSSGASMPLGGGFALHAVRARFGDLAGAYTKCREWQRAATLRTPFAPVRRQRQARTAPLGARVFEVCTQRTGRSFGRHAEHYGPAAVRQSARGLGPECAGKMGL